MGVESLSRHCHNTNDNNISTLRNFALPSQCKTVFNSRHQHCKQLCGNILVLAFVVLHRATTTSLAGGCCFGPTVQRNKTIHKKASSYTRNY
mmetsp:Transcript_16951/g.31693  ORF Transcript_16951/g.31693 Transcript_16951/m.31693 type:complete len:92 (-) Transcript_16951:1386-1661(-)